MFFFLEQKKRAMLRTREHNLEPHDPDKVILLMAMLLSPLRARPVHITPSIVGVYSTYRQTIY